MFEKNIGPNDRIARAVIGLALVIWAMMGGPLIAWIGILLLVTAGMSSCYLYKLAGFSTAPPPPNKNLTENRYGLKKKR